MIDIIMVYDVIIKAKEQIQPTFNYQVNIIKKIINPRMYSVRTKKLNQLATWCSNPNSDSI